MRVKIVAPVSGRLDGFALDQLEVGGTYDVGPALAVFLTEGGHAQLVADDWPARLAPLPPPDDGAKSARRK